MSDSVIGLMEQITEKHKLSNEARSAIFDLIKLMYDDSAFSVEAIDHFLTPVITALLDKKEHPVAEVKTIIHFHFRSDSVLAHDTINSPLPIDELVELTDDYQVFYGFWDVDGSYIMHNAQDIQTLYFEPMKNDTSR